MSTNNWETDQLKELFQILSSLDSPEELAMFMRDVATIKELTEMSKRWQAAKMIDKKIPYREISEKTGLSTTTVSRVAFWLNNGEGGYGIALDLLSQKSRESSQK